MTETLPPQLLAQRLDAVVAFTRAARARRHDREAVRRLVLRAGTYSRQTEALRVEVDQLLAQLDGLAAEQFVRAVQGNAKAREVWQLLAEWGDDLAVEVVQLLDALDELTANVCELLDATVAVVSIPATVEGLPEPRRILLGSLSPCAP